MYTVYWYPKCSTCQKAKKWLDENHISYELKDIVTETPKKEAFQQWLEADPENLRKFFNTSGMVYRELGLKDKVSKLTSEEASELLSSNGMLVKRPLITKNNEFLLNGFKESQYEEKVK